MIHAFLEEFNQHVEIDVRVIDLFLLDLVARVLPRLNRCSQLVGLPLPLKRIGILQHVRLECGLVVDGRLVGLQAKAMRGEQVVAEIVYSLYRLSVTATEHPEVINVANMLIASSRKMLVNIVKNRLGEDD